MLEHAFSPITFHLIDNKFKSQSCFKESDFAIAVDICFLDFAVNLLMFEGL